MRQRGFSLMEIVITLAISAVVLGALLSVFTTSNSHSVASRHRVVAIQIAESLMDDVETHRFGHPEPLSWKERELEPVKVWVSGRPQVMKFHQSVSYENGSAVGTASGSSDIVTITISWNEDNDNPQSLEVRVPVWK